MLSNGDNPSLESFSNSIGALPCVLSCCSDDDTSGPESAATGTLQGQFWSSLLKPDCKNQPLSDGDRRSCLSPGYAWSSIRDDVDRLHVAELKATSYFARAMMS